MKTFVGKVVSTKMMKTVTVEVARDAEHPVYGKRVKRTKKYLCHYEGNALKVGDTVTIKEVRPLSKNKRFEVVANTEGSSK